MHNALQDYQRSITRTYLSSWSTEEAFDVFLDDPAETVIPLPETSVEELIIWNDKLHVCSRMTKAGV